MSRISSCLPFLVVAAILLSSTPASAQPFSFFLGMNRSSTVNGYAAIPASSAFDFTNGFTFEAWVSATDSNGSSCSSIAGKNWQQAWWVGVCGTTLRSYIKGATSQFNGGTIPANTSTWTHIAVTYDGTTRRHYIDGEEVGTHAESGSMTASTDELRIGSDVSWQFTPSGFIDEVRLWNVARSTSDLRSTITSTFSTPATGLVAVYHFDGSVNDAVAGHNGALRLTAGYYDYGTCASCCVANATTHCFGGGRFKVTSSYVDQNGGSGVGTTVPGATADSGLFWFFSANNWELLVKTLDGCGLNNRKWVFAAGTTNQHFSLVVQDMPNRQIKRYFNYLGTAAPAITDTAAFATCP